MNGLVRLGLADLGVLCDNVLGSGGRVGPPEAGALGPGGPHLFAGHTYFCNKNI